MALRELQARGGKVSYNVVDVAKATEVLSPLLRQGRPLSGQEDVEMGTVDDHFPPMKLGDRLDILPVSRLLTTPAHGPSVPADSSGGASSAVLKDSAEDRPRPAESDPGETARISFVLTRTEKGREKEIAQSTQPVKVLDELRENQKFYDGFQLQDEIHCVVCKRSLQEDAAAVARGEKSGLLCLHARLVQCDGKHGTSFVHAGCLRDSLKRLDAAAKCPVCQNQDQVCLPRSATNQDQVWNGSNASAVANYVRIATEYSPAFVSSRGASRRAVSSGPRGVTGPRPDPENDLWEPLLGGE